jgi:ferredoxin
VSRVLRVNPIACDGRGICAELLPERIELDDWGYPILDPEPIPASLEVHARRAVAACPTLALRFEQAAASRELEPVARAGEEEATVVVARSRTSP